MWHKSKRSFRKHKHRYLKKAYDTGIHRPIQGCLVFGWCLNLLNETEWNYTKWLWIRFIIVVWRSFFTFLNCYCKLNTSEKWQAKALDLNRYVYTKKCCNVLFTTCDTYRHSNVYKKYVDKIKLCDILKVRNIDRWLIMKFQEFIQTYPRFQKFNVT